MAQIEVEAAAHVLGMKVGTRGRYEDTPFLRGAIKGGHLLLVAELAEAAAPGEQWSYDEGFEAAEAIARARHPAGKKLAADAAAPGEVT